MDALPSQDIAELYLLGFFAAAVKMRDRRGSSTKIDPKTGATIGVPHDHGTNLPVSADDLIAKHHAPAAEELVFAMTLPLGAFDDEIYTPGALARGIFMRSDGPLAGTNLAMIQPHLLDPDETAAVRTMTMRFKAAAHKLAFRGLLNLAPPGYDEEIPHDAAGWAKACRITGEGLREARRRTRGTKYENWSDSILDAINDDARKSAPEWAKAEWRQKKGFSS